MECDYYVYTDGACIDNGKSTAKAGIGVYFGENDNRNISKKVIGKQSNNVAELTAIIETYSQIEKDITNKKICIVTDSRYALLCIGMYGKRQEKNKWKNKIPNQELVKKIYELYKNTNIKFMHIKAHTTNSDIHSIGNRKADILANMAIN